MHVPLDDLEYYLEQKRTGDKNLEFSTFLKSGEEVLIKNRPYEKLSVDDEYNGTRNIWEMTVHGMRHLSVKVDEDWRRKGIGTLMYRVRAVLDGLPELETTGRLDRFLFLLKMGYVPRWVATRYCWDYHKQPLEQINYERLLYGEFVEKFPEIRHVYPEYVPFWRKIFWITEKNLGGYCVMGYSPEEALEFAQKIGYIREMDKDNDPSEE